MRRLGLALVAAAGILAMACGTGAGGPPSRQASRPQVLAGIGASDAVGIGAIDPDRENWVAQLAARFPAGTRVLNLGIGGAQADRAAEQELPVALDAEPSLVVVWLGVNDFSDNVPLPVFSRSLDAILTTLHQNGRTRVLVGNLPDLRLIPAFRARDPTALDRGVTAWNEEIDRIARGSGATVVDIHGGWTELRDHPEYVSSDGLHPTAAGYRRVADLFWRAISDQPSAVSRQPTPPRPGSGWIGEAPPTLSLCRVGRGRMAES